MGIEGRTVPHLMLPPGRDTYDYRMAMISTAPTVKKERARLVHARLVAQGLVRPCYSNAADAVRSFGAMQGQDLPGVVSSIALRIDLPAAVADGEDPRVRSVADAFSDGTVVRGYPMRGTVFALAGADARWITELAAKPKDWEAPRRRAGLGIEPHHVDKARAAAETLLAEHPRGVSRADLFRAWNDAGVSADGGVGYHLTTYFIASGLLIYGPHNGRDNNLVLAETWLPKDSGLEAGFNGDRIAATAQLLNTYLVSHGPATLRDFAWWTKLPLRDIRTARGFLGDAVVTWGTDGAGDDLLARPTLEAEVHELADQLDDLHLLPGFDELVLGYQDRLALLSEEQHKVLAPGNNGVFMKSMVRRGQIVGTWRSPKASGAAGHRNRRPLKHEPFAPLPKTAERELARAYARYPHADSLTMGDT